MLGRSVNRVMGKVSMLPAVRGEEICTCIGKSFTMLLTPQPFFSMSPRRSNYSASLTR